MYFDELGVLFSREGYRCLSGRAENVYLFYKYICETFHIVTVVELDSGAPFFPDRQPVLDEYVKSIFYHPQGKVPGFLEDVPVCRVENLTLFVGTDMEQIRNVCLKCANTWGYVLPEARLIVYENQPGDFWGLRHVLEVDRNPTERGKPEKGRNDTWIKKDMPWMTIILMAVNIIGFLFLEIIGDTENGAFIAEYGGLYPKYIKERNQWWRILTSGFIHFGAIHLANNMVIFCCIGSRLERAVGSVKFLLIYFLSEIGGGLLSYCVMLYTEDYAVSAGASGAVFGTIAGLLWVVIFHKGCFGGITVRGLLLMLALSLYYGFSTMGVDNWGHIGGAATGFVSAIILYHRKRQTG